MASVRKFPGSQFWYAVFRLPNGKQRQVSTHTTDREDALRQALSYERASSLARARRLTRGTARRILREIELAAGLAPTLSDLTVREFLRERRAALALHLKGRTLERYAYALDHLGETRADFADLPLADFSPAEAIAWRDALRGEGLAVSTVNHQIAVLRAQWRDARQRGLVEANPFEDIALPGTRKQRQRRRPFTFAQFEALLRALRGATELADAAEWRLLVKVAAYTGQRENDCAHFDKAAIEAGRRVMRFTRGKNADEFEVPVHAALWPDLAAALKAGAHGPLFPALAQRPRTGRNSLPDTFRQKILPLIGIAQPYATAAERGSRRGRRLAAYSFHSLRHSLSTWLNDAGVSDVDRARIVGHSDRDVSRGYTHAELDHARRAIAKLPRTRH